MSGIKVKYISFFVDIVQLMKAIGLYTDDEVNIRNDGTLVVNWNNHGNANQVIGGTITCTKTIVLVSGESETIWACTSAGSEIDPVKFNSTIRAWMHSHGFEFIGWDKTI